VFVPTALCDDHRIIGAKHRIIVCCAPPQMPVVTMDKAVIGCYALFTSWRLPRSHLHIFYNTHSAVGGKEKF